MAPPGPIDDGSKDAAGAPRPVLLTGANSAAAAAQRVLQAAGTEVVVELEPLRLPAHLPSVQPRALLIAADVRSPQGLDVFQGGLQAASARNIPIVVISPAVDESRAQQLLLQGIAGVVQTPCSKERLVQLAAYFAADQQPQQRPHVVDSRPTGQFTRLMRHAQAYGLTTTLQLDTPAGAAHMRVVGGQVTEFAFGAHQGAAAFSALLQAPSQDGWRVSVVDDNAAEAAPAAAQPPPADVDLDVDVDDEPVQVDLAATNAELWQDIPELPPALPAATRQQRATVPPLQILLADDDASLLALYTKILSADDFAVVRTAQDGQEALELATQECPDVIISDAMMPRKDGWSFLVDVRADYRLYDTPFLMLSCQGEFLARLVDVGVGADDYLQKGVRAKEIRRRLKDVMRERQQLQAVVDKDLAFSFDLAGVGPRFVLEVLQDKSVSGTVQVWCSQARYQLHMLYGQIQAVTSTHDGQGSGLPATQRLLAEVGGTLAFVPSSPPAGAEPFFIRDVERSLLDGLNAEVDRALLPYLDGSRALTVVDERRKEALLTACLPEQAERLGAFLQGTPVTTPPQDRAHARALLQQLLRLQVASLA